MPHSQSFDREFHPGELVMVGIEGKRLDSATAEFLRNHHIRAVCLFRPNLGTEAEVHQLTADLREVMGPGALIAMDQEGGATARATFLPQAPSAMCLGATDDEGLAERVGAAVARGVRSLGFNWNFAPVLDVNNNPRNPVIAERSFSEDPAAVARLAGAWMRGASHERVACCVKHFPGHGDTHVDSHLDLPVVDKSHAELAELELLPFHLLCHESPAIMTAHIVYPQIDPEHPATLSRTMLGDCLRGEWNYDGVVITDSLVMKAIHDRYGHDRASVLALLAGADMVMALGNREEQLAAMRAIGAAATTGELPQGELQRSRARLDALALRFPASHYDYTPAKRAEDDALMSEAWARGLCASASAQRPTVEMPIRVITQRSAPSDMVSEEGLTGDAVSALFAGFPDVVVEQMDDLGTLDWAQVAQDRRFTILVSSTRARYSSNAACWRPDLHIVLWNPYQVLDVNAPAVMSWGYATGALDAVRNWLEGGPAAGRSPVSLHATAD